MEAKELYLNQVDKCGKNGTSKHVVFFWLFPEQRQVLNQTAYIWSDLQQKNQEKTKYTYYREIQFKSFPDSLSEEKWWKVQHFLKDCVIIAKTQYHIIYDVQYVKKI